MENKKYQALSRAVAMAYNAAEVTRSVLPAPGHPVVDGLDRAAFNLLLQMVSVDAPILVDVPQTRTVAYVVSDMLREELAHGEVTDAQVRDLHEKAVAEHAEAVAAGAR